MKKAKDYAALYKASKNKPETIMEIFQEFHGEILDLVDTRGAATTRSIIAILKELNIKWKAFAKKAGTGVMENGFINLIKAKYPFLKDDLAAEGL